jgi:hypothetical protein
VFELSCRELLLQYKVNIQGIPKKEKFSDFQSMAIVGATAEDLGINMTLQIPDSLLRFTFPPSLPCTEHHHLLDWIGELGNQLVGRFKNKILHYNCNLRIDIPHVVYGSDLRVNMPRLSSMQYLDFSSDIGDLRFTLSVVLDPEFPVSFSEFDASAVEKTEAGELTFF